MDKIKASINLIPPVSIHLVHTLKNRFIFSKKRCRFHQIAKIASTINKIQPASIKLLKIHKISSMLCEGLTVLNYLINIINDKVNKILINTAIIWSIIILCGDQVNFIPSHMIFTIISLQRCMKFFSRVLQLNQKNQFWKLKIY